MDHVLRAPVRAAAVVAIVLLTAIRPGATRPGGATLRVNDESAPPGGTVQMKIVLTEPTPISTGGGSFGFAEALDFIDGVSISSPADDTYGVAVVEHGRLSVTFASGTASFGAGDYPILTITGRVRADAARGAVLPFAIVADALRLNDPSGVPYLVEGKDGALTIEDTLSIDDVQPGSGAVAAGDVVTVRGTGFTPQTELQLGGVDVDATLFVSPTQIDVRLGEAKRMHGVRVRARNRKGIRPSYFSYQRTARSGSSTRPELNTAVPLFPGTSVLTAEVAATEPMTALAVQNLLAEPATFAVDLVASDGTALATIELSLPSNHFLVREDLELFGVAAPAGSTLRIRAASAVQVMGVTLDADARLVPISPR